MRIKVLLNLGYGLPKFRQDEIHQVDEATGQMLVSRHWAVPLPEEESGGESRADAAAPTFPPSPGKFEAMRRHPDHITKKSSPPRRRASKQSNHLTGE